MGWLGPGQNLAVAGEEIQLLKSDLPESAGLHRDQGCARLFLGERYGDAIRGKRPRRLIRGPSGTGASASKVDCCGGPVTPRGEYSYSAGTESPAGVLPPGTALPIPPAAFGRAFSLERGDAARGPVTVSLFVVDASVAAKWFLPAEGETLTDEALELLYRYTTGQIRLIVPDLFWAEFANILWKAVRQGRWTKDAADTAIAAMKDRNLPTVPSLALLEAAFAIANAFQRTVYDSLYVALAISSKAQLLTADERLAHALAATLPVKWLGSL